MANSVVFKLGCAALVYSFANIFLRITNFMLPCYIFGGIFLGASLKINFLPRRWKPIFVFLFVMCYLFVLLFIKLKWERKSIGVQVSIATQTAETTTERIPEKLNYQKNLTDIFDRLKIELVDLHAHIERQSLYL